MYVPAVGYLYVVSRISCKEKDSYDEIAKLQQQKERNLVSSPELEMEVLTASSGMRKVLKRKAMVSERR